MATDESYTISLADILKSVTAPAGVTNVANMHDDDLSTSANIPANNATPVQIDFESVYVSAVGLRFQGTIQYTVYDDGGAVAASGNTSSAGTNTVQVNINKNIKRIVLNSYSGVQVNVYEAILFFKLPPKPAFVSRRCGAFRRLNGACY
jgi:hypothetical protein